MKEIPDFFRKLFNTTDFPPRWHCGNWTDFHGWLYIISDTAIWAAYFAIPVLIVKFISKRTDARFVRLYFLFAAFILACGSTHLLDAIDFWFPVYRFNALLLFITAIVSWMTVFSLMKVLPLASSLRTAEQLEAEIEQRRKAEEQLKVNNAMLTEALDIARLGHWQWDVRQDKITWSVATLKIFGMPIENSEMTYEEYLQILPPGERERVDKRVNEAIQERTFPEFYHTIVLPGGKVRILLGRGEVITDDEGKVIRLIGTVQDVTDQKHTEQELLLKTQKLEASNDELQKFASIASHDLREPLRKIITFGSMLEREYSELLDEKGNLYLQKMTGASLRMQKLIDGILDFSRLTINTKVFGLVQLNEMINHVLSDMEVAITKSNAKIIIDPLPAIEGNASQLGQLFQNLVSNAIKFRKPGEDPYVQISSRQFSNSEFADFIGSKHYQFTASSQYCLITVADKGIGFDDAYLDKIFLIFQRLHSNTEYEGTGVGLAVCKKVVDLHNGYITAYSKLGKGATFIIILPVTQSNP